VLGGQLVVTLVLGFVAGVLFSSGVWVVVTGWRPRRPSRRQLAERLAPFAPTPLADEAEEWLQGR
jgi:hypothetical protein